MPFRPLASMFSRFSLALVLGAVLLVMGCRLGGETRYEDTITFPDLYDSLKQYERAVIIVTNDEGRVLDTVFNGPVGNAEELRGLALENWDGGDATIRIIGISGGREVYLLEKRIDGSTRRTESTVLVRTPSAALSAAVREYLLLEGDSLPLPAIAVGPADLADKSLLWSSSHPDIVAVGAAHLKGLRAGAAQLTARLRSDDSKSLAILVKVALDARIPERLTVVPETLRVAAGGAPQRASAKGSPSSSDASVLWSTDDDGTATVQADGTLRGLRQGVTRLRAASKWKASVTASAVVVVSDPVPVQKVRFLADSAALYLGGAPESLLVEVLPPAANPAITLVSLSPEVAAVRGGRLHAAAEGRTAVVAVSTENPALADTLEVRVYPAPGVDSVRIAPRRLKLYVGGDAGSLAARVSPPTAPEAVRWLSGNPALAHVDAAGRVFPLAAGNLCVYAVSAADSLSRDSVEVAVMVDAPVVTVGADTVLPVGGTLAVLPVVAPQAFGVVTAFKWDLDGDLAWDDSAAAVKAVSRRYDAEGIFMARFLVRDSEGNETLVRKQVRVLKGRIVRILAPADNSYSREASIPVRWSVDGIEQDSLTTQSLAEGPNFITRSAPDSAGRMVTATALVTLDAVPPESPVVKGPDWVRTSLPSWSFTSGGGGSGAFRVALDAETFPAGSESRDTVFVPAQDLSEGPHTLYVQERDAAGNWSSSGRHTLRVDLTPPGRPTLLVEPGIVTNAPKPTFRWQSGGGGMGVFQFKLDSAAFGDPTTGLSYSPSANLAAGGHGFTVRERDSAGHWSAAASVTVTLDFTAPEPPLLAGTSPTSALPRWTWTSGGNGGSGDFRLKVGSDGNPANGGTETRALEYVLPAAVSGTSYTLYVQERDGAGNWSTIASLPIVYDLTRPSVTIRSPQAAGTYLTRQAAVDVSGASSKPEGGSPIEAVTYTLDGVAGALPTNLAADGTWSIRGLPLTNNETVELKVTARDQSGNSGEAILLLAMDSTPPAPPVFTSQPPALVNAADTRTTLAWSWTRSGAATDSFVVRLNGTVVSRQTDTSYSTGTLSDGVYALQVSALDLAGNQSTPSAATSVTVDRTPAAAPSPTAASPTRDNTPTWTWSRAGGTAFEYRLARDAAPTGAGTAHADTAYTPGTALLDGAWQFQVRARDAAGNWSPWSNSATVVVKAAAPAAPVISRNAAVSNAPQWTWVTGGGGNGTFRYHWSGVAATLGEGTATAYAPTGLPEQAHTLCVAERDAVGYGPDACQGITVDRTPPVLAGYNVADGFITNRSPITIRFTRDGVADSLSCALTDGGSKSCQKSVSDAAGNTANAMRTIWYRSNVVFVKAGQTGTRGGSSWEDAYGDVGTALAAIAGRSGRMEVWVTEGDYSGFTVDRSSTSVYGGFPVTGNPNSVSFRDPENRISKFLPSEEHVTCIVIMGKAGICRDAILDGFHIRKGTNQAIAIFNAENASIRNIWIEENDLTGVAGIVQVANGSHVFENMNVRDNIERSFGAIYMYGASNLTIRNSDISYNFLETGPGNTWGSGGIYSEYGGRLTLRNTRLVRNGSSGNSFQAFNYGLRPFDIDSCVVDGLRDYIYPLNNDSLVIWGRNNRLP